MICNEALFNFYRILSFLLKTCQEGQVHQGHGIGKASLGEKIVRMLDEMTRKTWLLLTFHHSF